MKKKGILIFSIIFIFLINLITTSAEIRINEIELNPEGPDTGNEWIELYSNNEVNLTGWKIINHNNKTVILNQIFKDYFIINFQQQFLNNEDEAIELYHASNLIFSTPILNDNSNDNRTWNFCNGVWNFVFSSYNHSNICAYPSNNTNIPKNQTNNNAPSSSASKQGISLKIDWNKNEIKNGEEFNIEVKAFNLEDKNYDIKVYIYDKDKNKPISQTYDYDNKWISSNNYIKEFFKSPGDNKEYVKLRIKQEYKDFEGDAKIGVRIRETGASSYKKEINEDIKILKADEKKDINQTDDSNYKISKAKTADNNSTVKKSEEDKSINQEIIYLTSSKLETEDIKTKNNVIYESKNELIKKYSIYFFAFLCVIIIFLLVFKKSR